MRRRDEDKRKKYSAIFISVFTALLMITSMAGIFLGGDNEGSSLKYNRYKFKFENNLYSVKIDGKLMQFFTSPNEAESINMSAGVKNTMRNYGEKVITFNPDNEEKQIVDNIRFRLFSIFNEQYPVVNAVTYSSDTYNLPVINCSSASENTTVIFIDDNFNYTEPNISFSDGCITLKGNGRDLLLLSDRLIYSYEGVIE